MSAGVGKRTSNLAAYRLQRAEDIRALIAQHPKWSDLDVARALGGVSRQLVAYYRDEIKAEDRQGTLPMI